MGARAEGRRHVAYGLVGLKTHSSYRLSSARKKTALRAYYHSGTGNYNPKTAALYTDLGFFSCRPDIGADIMDVFNYLTGYSRQIEYRKLLVAPVNMRQKFLELIDTEIANALRGRPARVIGKMNGMEDPVLARKLYEASQAGVQIDLIVRGNCRVRPGLPGVSENIRVISIIGRFLEHPRIWYFENNGSPRYYIGSADWMKRNLSNRVEAIVPIEDPRLQAQIYHILQASIEDDRQAWEMLPDGRYRQRQPKLDGNPLPLDALGSQQALMRHARLTTSQLRDDIWSPEPTGFARRITHQKRRRARGSAGSMVRHVFLQTRHVYRLNAAVGWRQAKISSTAARSSSSSLPVASIMARSKSLKGKPCTTEYSPFCTVTG